MKLILAPIHGDIVKQLLRFLVASKCDYNPELIRCFSDLCNGSNGSTELSLALILHPKNEIDGCRLQGLMFRILRLERNLTQEELANELSISQSTISLTEKHGTTDTKILRLYADFFDRPIEDFILTKPCQVLDTQKV